MDSSRFSLLLLSLFLTTLFAIHSGTDGASGAVADDLLIRQVIDRGSDGVDELGDPLLSPHLHFSLFKRRFGISYASEEEHNYGFKVFKANLRRARRHKLLEPSARHGVTQFSDLTPSEFKRKFLGLRSRLRLPVDANKAPILPTDNLPADFDWRKRAALTAPKNQGSCG